MTVWRADEVSLELASITAELPSERVSAACRGLIEKRLVDPLDEASATYRLTVPAPVHARERELRRRHARFVSDSIGPHVAEAEAVFGCACHDDWDLAVLLGKRLFDYLSAAGRADEKVLVLNRLGTAAEQRGDREILNFVRNELSWISGSPWEHPAAAGAEQLQLEFGLQLR
jgi:hypothetical protein